MPPLFTRDSGLGEATLVALHAWRRIQPETSRRQPNDSPRPLTRGKGAWGWSCELCARVKASNA